VRTYSHALLTWAAARRTVPTGPAAWAALGATLPDLPVLAGAAWLAARRVGRFSRAELDAEVCARRLFRSPDAALHSVLPVAGALSLYGATGARRRNGGGALLALLLGWAGHVATDTLTHGSDARPLLWPLFSWRFHSPVSYRERGRYALPFTVAEHAAVLAALIPSHTEASGYRFQASGLFGRKRVCTGGHSRRLWGPTDPKKL
jgi:hypothetical protein